MEAIILDKRNKVEVNIYGKSITLISNESEEYMLNIAMYLNKKIDEIKNVHNAITKTLLLSINIADELFKEREKNNKMEKEIMDIKTQLAKTNYKLSRYTQDLRKGNK